NFLASGDGEIVNPTADDGSSDVIFLQQPFKYFGRTYNRIFVNNNGHLTFTEPLSAYNPSLDSGRDIIAPLWTRLDNRRGGTISYREDTSSTVLAQATAAVKRYFPSIPFAATSAFVATWDSVPYYNGGGVATFQVVLAYNVHRSFILIYYGDVAETGLPWQAGFYTVDSINSFTIPASSAPELSSSSNINVTACRSFHVDGSPNLPSNFLPFGNGERVTPRLDNGSSEAIILQQPFKYFGRTYSQIFVNNNGHLTFNEQLSVYIPLLNSGRDIIAPLWTHLDNRHGGTISYREDTSSAVLAQVNAALNQYFPNLPLPFNTTSAFVATWDSVPYSSGEGVVTFQLVLLSNVDHSFILFNYGNIAETRQQWLAHYGTVDFAHSYTCSLLTSSELSSNSNVNINGRWVFQVYNVCDTLNCTRNEVCHFRDGYGCGCLEGQRPNPESFDATEFCSSSTGTISLSRCQLFESYFPPEFLHLNDPNCTGTVEDGRVLFHFDNEGHICGTTLSSNGTHFIYQNSIHSILPTGVITRERWMNITFSCVYPLIQTLSMPKDIQAEQRYKSERLGVFPCPPDLKHGDQEGMENLWTDRNRSSSRPRAAPFLMRPHGSRSLPEARPTNTSSSAYTAARRALAAGCDDVKHGRHRHPTTPPRQPRGAEREYNSLKLPNELTCKPPDCSLRFASAQTGPDSQGADVDTSSLEKSAK
ncbi:Sushi, nidogen and EGF-like domain-containing protein 1, partial [Anabarilius grahami]